MSSCHPSRNPLPSEWQKLGKSSSARSRWRQQKGPVSGAFRVAGARFDPISDRCGDESPSVRQYFGLARGADPRHISRARTILRGFRREHARQGELAGFRGGDAHLPAVQFTKTFQFLIRMPAPRIVDGRRRGQRPRQSKGVSNDEVCAGSLRDRLNGCDPRANALGVMGSAGVDICAFRGAGAPLPGRVDALAQAETIDGSAGRPARAARPFELADLPRPYGSRGRGELGR